MLAAACVAAVLIWWLLGSCLGGRLPVLRATIAGVACVAVGSGLVAVGLHVPGIALIVSGPLLSAGQVAMGSGHPD